MWQKNSEERERNSKINSLAYMKSDSFTYFACWFRIGFSSLFQAFIGGGGGEEGCKLIRTLWAQKETQMEKSEGWTLTGAGARNVPSLFPPYFFPRQFFTRALIFRPLPTIWTPRTVLKKWPASPLVSSAEDVSAWRSSSSHVRKNLWYPGYQRQRSMTTKLRRTHDIS